MRFQRNRFTYIALTITIMILGLSTRHFRTYLPNWINLYLGDILWALMIFFLFGVIFKTIETKWVAGLTLLFSFSIEISQLYHSPWIDILRSTTLGGLVLGYGFLWSDLVSYSIGICIGVFIERNIIIKTRR